MRKIVLAVAVAGFAFPALAQAPDFESVDVDQSGSLTLPELKAVFPELTLETFNAVDVDASGDLSPEEYAAATGG